MHNLLVKKIRACMVGVFLLSGLTITLAGQIYTPLEIASTTNWDIRSDNKGNLYILWGNDHNIYFATIENRVVTGKQLIADNGVANKYGLYTLSVSPNGKHISVFYRTTSWNLRHAWRDSDGVWRDERIPAERSENGYWFQSGAVSNDGTVHAIYAVAGSYYYTYKKGEKWVKSIEFDSGGVSGGVMTMDSNGGVHMIWMPYKAHIGYRYAPLGQTLDKYPTEKLTVKGIPVLGTGGLYVSPSGVVHITAAGANSIWHFYKKQVGSGGFSTATCPSLGSVGVTKNDRYSAVGADHEGRVYVSWGEAKEDSNKIKLSVLDKGKWKVSTPSKNAKISSANKPVLAMTYESANFLWNNREDELIMYSIPLIPVSSAINIGHFTERSFFKFYRFNRITWEDSQFNIEFNIHIDHYNIYRKSKTAEKYDVTPLTTNIPASTHTFEDISSAVNTAQQNFDYYVTTVALVNGQLVESSIVY
jgi:hypothetical protein